MKCSNPACSRNIGLVAYRRGWLSKRRYCSRNCRDAVVVIDRAKRAHRERSHATYVEWLFEEPALNAQLKLVPTVSARLQPGQAFGWRRVDGAE
jgi:hypothetical protein